MGFIWTSFVGDVHGAEYCHGMKEQTEVQCKMLINPPLTPCIALIVPLLHTYPQQDDPLANNRVLAPANVDHHAQIIATRYIIEHPPTPAEFSRLTPSCKAPPGTLRLGITAPGHIMYYRMN